MACDFTRHKHLLAIFVASLAVSAAAMSSPVDIAQAQDRSIAQARCSKRDRPVRRRSRGLFAGGDQEVDPSVARSAGLPGATVGGSVYGETSNPPWNMKPLETFEAHSGHAADPPRFTRTGDRSTRMSCSGSRRTARSRC